MSKHTIHQTLTTWRFKLSVLILLNPETLNMSARADYWASTEQVLNFFQLLYAIAKIAIITARIILLWFHIRSSHMIYFICIIHLHIFHGNIWTQNWPAPNVSGFIAQLVRASHRYREVTGSSPVQVLNFFQASLRNCKNCDHNCEDHSSLISYPQFTYDLFHMHHSPT